MARMLNFGHRLRYLALLFVAWYVFAWTAAEFLVVREPLPRADAIVVLSGSAVYAERTERAAQLYHQNFSKLVILTNDNLQGGWSSADQRNPFFYELARDNLIRLGVSSENIDIIYHPVFSTYEEATMLRSYAESRKLRSLLIVTSAYHSRRALWTLRQRFGGTSIEIGLEPVKTGVQTPSPSLWWIRFGGWKDVAGEYVKHVYYRLFKSD